MPLDAVGLVVDMHVAFTPDGWGREALEAERAAVARAFADGAALLVTYEVEGWRRSQPPRSFGFKPAADFLPHPLIGKRTRTWFLTHAAWTASPAARRLEVASCPG